MKLQGQPSKIIFAGAFALLVSCAGNKYPKAENALDAAREFISASLQGDFKKASFYMLNDAENQNNLNKAQREYNFKSGAEKQQYYEASIVINEDATLSDSVHIINFKNSYDNIARKVKVVYSNKAWLVDFKYTFNGNL